MKSTHYTVSLRVEHPELDLSVVPASLGLSAKHIWRAGDERRTPKGTVLRALRDNSYCIIDFEGSGRLRDQLNSVLSKLSAQRPLFENITSSGGRISLFVGWFSSGDSGETIDSAILNRMGELYLGLDLN